MADQIDISQYDWETSQDGDKVIAIPIATLQTRVQHTYEALNITPGLTIDGRDLELVWQQRNHFDRGGEWHDLTMENRVGNWNIRQIIRLKTPAVEGYMDYRNPFEDYPMLANRLLHAANFWKTDDTWSSTLAEINKVCEIANGSIETIVQQTLKYIAERGTVCHGTRIIDCEELLSLQPEIIKVIKEKVK